MKTLRLRSILCLTLLSIASITFLCAKDVTLLPKEDWRLSDDGQYSYAVVATEDSLTLQIELFTPWLKMLSQRAGLKAYVDITGQKKEKYMVSFPVIDGFVDYLLNEEQEGISEAQKPKDKNAQLIMGKHPKDGLRPGAMDDMYKSNINFNTLWIPSTVEPLQLGSSYPVLYIDDSQRKLSKNDVTLSYEQGRMFYTLSLPMSTFGRRSRDNELVFIALSFEDLGENGNDSAIYSWEQKNSQGKKSPNGKEYLGKNPNKKWISVRITHPQDNGRGRIY